MSDYCVVVADGAHARVYSLDEHAVGESGPDLVEHQELSNPDAETAGKDLYSDDKSGRNVSKGAGAHGYDDHRSHHDEVQLQRFAKHVADVAVNVAGHQHARQLIMVAEKSMMGHLRTTLKVPQGAHFTVTEVAKDLCKLNAIKLHERLAVDGLLPPRAPGV